MSRSSRKLLRRAGVAGLMAGFVAMPLLATASPAGADTNALSTTTASTADGVNTNVASGDTLHNLVDGEIVSLHIATASSSQLNGIIDARQCDNGATILDSASMIPSNTGLCLDHPFPGSKGQESTGNLVKAGNTDAFIDVSFKVGRGTETVTYDDGHPTLQHNQIICNSSAPDCTLWIEVSVNGDSTSEFVHFNLDFTDTSPGTPGDLTGDGKADLTVFRPQTGEWFIDQTNSLQFGTDSDVPVPGDYDGDGTTDIAVYRESNNTWYIAGQYSLVFGTAGDIPVPGDYDGDGKTDIAVFRPQTGTWYIAGQYTSAYGVNGDIPVPGDYDGNGTTDLAVFRPTNNTWYVAGQYTTTFGTNDDVPVPGDYNGDGLTDVAVFRPSNGTWYIAGQYNLAFGASGDTPVPADYNGDGKTDIAVFRSNPGDWSVAGQFSGVHFGTIGDVPVNQRPGQ